MKVKVIRYFNTSIIDFTYTVDDGEDCPCERDLSADYYPAASHEALEAKLARLEQAAQRLVDHAKNSDQELWASLPDVLNLSDVLDKMEDIENEKP